MIINKPLHPFIALTLFGLSLSTLSTTASAELKSFEDKSNQNHYYCGFKNEKGQIVVPAKYEFCGDLSDGMAYVGKSKLDQDMYRNYFVGYINDSAKLVIPVVHQAEYMDSNINFNDYSEGVVAVFKNGKYGYMDKKGKLVIPYLYQSAGKFKDGLAVVCKDYKCGAINKSGKTVVPFKFHYLDDYSEGLAAFRSAPWGQKGKSGFIDTKGDIAIKAKWDNVMPFAEGLAAVKVGGYDNAKWGVINKAGKIIVRPKYDNAYIEQMGDAIEVDGGRYENGKIDMYDVDNVSYKVTRYTLNKKGQVINKKTYADWYEVAAERHP